MKVKEYFLLPLILTLLTLGVAGFILFKNIKFKSDFPTTNPENNLTKQTTSNLKITVTPYQENIHSDSIYNQPSSIWRAFTVNGCSNENASKITFSLPPGIWNIIRSTSDKNITYFASNVQPTMDFNFGCTTDRTKFDPEINECVSQYTEQELIRFNVGGMSANSCYEPRNKRLWPFYLPVDEDSQSQIYIWSHNMDKDMLTKLFASFQFN